MVCGPGSLATRSRRVMLAHPGPTAPGPSPCRQLTPVLGQAVQGPHPLLSAPVSRSLQARRLSSVPPTTPSPLKPLGLPPGDTPHPYASLGSIQTWWAEQSLTDMATPSPGSCICSPGPLGLHGGPTGPCPASTGPTGTALAPLPGDQNCLCCFPVAGPELIRTRDPTGRVSTSPRMTPQEPGCRA